MNFLPLLIGCVLLGSFGRQNKKQDGFDLSSLLSNQDVVSLLPHLAKVFDNNATQEDKNLAIMNLLTNPAIFEIVQKFATKQPEQQDKQKQNTDDKPQAEQKQDKTEQNFSAESQEFFAPIKDVADKQISKKLYSLYDNWYTKK
ncbi:MAG: hypothetical protein IJV77_00760 [Clostridia bacterium]|nr:hypothetical protein [Clostridia bacterium]